MIFFNRLLLVFALSSSFAMSSQTEKHERQSNEYILFDFEDASDISNTESDDASFELVDFNGSKGLKINTGYSAVKPTLILKEPKNKSWHLNGYYQVKADVTNVGDAFMQAEMFVGDDPDGLIKWFCSDYADLNPRETKTITINLAWTPWVFKPQLKVEGMRGTPGKIKTDIGAIKEITFCSRYASTDNQLIVDNIRAVGKLEERDTIGFFPFVDEFGQYKHKDWKDKVHSVAKLKEKTKSHLEDLSKSAPENLGKFGGWIAGPQLEATGFFRTEKYNDKWWMVDPEGYLFWTAGVNCVAPTSASTGITGREKYFEWIPEKKSKYTDFFGKGFPASHGFYKDKANWTSYNFYASNLYKAHGDDWQNHFRDMVHKRFRNWGLNTIGFVSDEGATKQRRTPYVGSIWIRETPKIEGSKGFWGKFHDVFDPAFRAAVKTSMSYQKNGAGDSWCIGYFVDNELAWGAEGSLAEGVLRSPEDQFAKQVFVKDLKEKYENINKLNEAWETSHDSWEALLKSKKVPNSALSKGDITNFYKKIAETYFRTIKEELNEIAPNQNYLGCRFAWDNNDIVLAAASNYMDIMSFNKYEYSVEHIGLPKGVDKPIMIGEFHFGALDRGNYHVGVKKAESQEDRGQKYQDYIQGALRNPLIVGAHWFQYIDEPLTGRFDGENYNVGLVDVCDTPYEELVDKIRETTYNMYNYRIENTTK